MQNSAAIVIADVHGRRIAVARKGEHVYLPERAPDRDDGRPGGRASRISRGALGAEPARATAFMDAALAAAFEELGMLVARPAGVRASPTREAEGWDRMRLHGLEPDRSALVYLGRALTPADAAPRRHVRVFAAPWSAVTNSLMRPAGADRTLWLEPQAFEDRIGDAALATFGPRALTALQRGAAPIRVSFRQGRRLEHAL